MTQLQIKPAAASVAARSDLVRRFVTRRVVSSISSLAGLISLVLTGPTMCRIAAVDPVLEAFYGALVAGWFASLERMWFLTFRDRIRQ
jgi:hypothetical protein